MIQVGNSLRCYQYNSHSAIIVPCKDVCAIISYTDSPYLSGSCINEEYCTLLNLGEKGKNGIRVNIDMRNILRLLFICGIFNNVVYSLLCYKNLSLHSRRIVKCEFKCATLEFVMLPNIYEKQKIADYIRS
ncbi:hypothetical protein CBL_09470 [Carabus blaptoides fortunei]